MSETEDVAVSGVNRLYRCGVCGVTSPDVDELRMHMIDVHIRDQHEEEIATEGDEFDGESL